MATAWLRRLQADGTGEVWYFEVPWPGDEPSFGGPDDRTWADLRRLDETTASFDWCTEDDHKARLARAFGRGELDARAVARLWPGMQDLEDDAADWWDSVGEDHPELGEAPAEQALVDAFLRAAAGGVATCGYAEDGDSQNQEAARALPYPPWARYEMSDEGGPGSGFEAAWLIIDAPHGFDDYLAWVQAHPGGA